MATVPTITRNVAGSSLPAPLPAAAGERPAARGVAPSHRRSRRRVGTHRPGWHGDRTHPGATASARRALTSRPGWRRPKCPEGPVGCGLTGMPAAPRTTAPAAASAERAARPGRPTSSSLASSGRGDRAMVLATLKISRGAEALPDGVGSPPGSRFPISARPVSRQTPPARHPRGIAAANWSGSG
jgi:hypothetical protein